jgi:hypothetical protein
MPECVAPGDYVLIDVCASCNVQGKCLGAGGGVEFHYSGCTGSVPQRGFVLCCKCGSMLRSHRSHRVLSADDQPLTITPSWLCTVNGCHSWIHGGLWSNC